MFIKDNKMNRKFNIASELLGEFHWHISKDDLKAFLKKNNYKLKFSSGDWHILKDEKYVGLLVLGFGIIQFFREKKNKGKIFIMDYFNRKNKSRILEKFKQEGLSVSENMLEGFSIDDTNTTNRFFVVRTRKYFSYRVQYTFRMNKKITTDNLISAQKVIGKNT